MNQRNVDAIALLLEEMEGGVGYPCARCQANAEFLASRGVLGPASTVLTDEDAHDIRPGVYERIGDDFPEGYDYHDHAMTKVKLKLERIAKGEV
jgi:hypothetical protein